MVFEDEAVEALGQESWDIVIGAAAKGQIRQAKMKDIASLLHPSVGGKHIWRMDRKPPDSPGEEMREILSDWYRVFFLTGPPSNPENAFFLIKLSTTFCKNRFIIHI